MNHGAHQNFTFLGTVDNDGVLLKLNKTEKLSTEMTFE